MAMIFDFDGTLADTMGDHFRAWQKAVGYYGVEIKEEDYYPVEGMSVRDLADLFGVPRDAAVKKDVEYRMNHEFKFYEGVEEFVEGLKKKKAIVTARKHASLWATVPYKFLEKFDVIVTGDDTVRCKPSPEPYELAMERMGVKPEECTVVENSPFGIKAAKAAGCYCIAVCTTLGREWLGEADEIVEDFKDIKVRE